MLSYCNILKGFVCFLVKLLRIFSYHIILLQGWPSNSKNQHFKHFGVHQISYPARYPGSIYSEIISLTGRKCLYVNVIYTAGYFPYSVFLINVARMSFIAQNRFVCFYIISANQHLALVEMQHL